MNERSFASGSALDVCETLNAAYYGKSATPVDILVKRGVSNPQAGSLRAAEAEGPKQLLHFI